MGKKKPVKQGKKGVVSPDPNFPKKGPVKKETAKVFPGSF